MLADGGGASPPGRGRYPHNPDSTTSIIARSSSAHTLPVDLFGHLQIPSIRRAAKSEDRPCRSRVQILMRREALFRRA